MSIVGRRSRKAQSGMPSLRQVAHSSFIQLQNAHLPCAGRPERQFASTRRCWTEFSSPAGDARAVKVFASGLTLFHRGQLPVDITLRSALTATGLLRNKALQWWMALCAWRWMWSLSRLAVVRVCISSNAWQWPGAGDTPRAIRNDQFFCPGGARWDFRMSDFMWTVVC